eukprot:6214695-Pleurochrysis_carterae.AAC.4
MTRYQHNFLGPFWWNLRSPSAWFRQQDMISMLSAARMKDGRYEMQCLISCSGPHSTRRSPARVVQCEKGSDAGWSGSDAALQRAVEDGIW